MNEDRDGAIEEEGDSGSNCELKGLGSTGKREGVRRVLLITREITVHTVRL